MGIEISTYYRILVLVAFAVYTAVLIGIVVKGQKAQKKASESFEKSYFAGGRDIGGITLGIMIMATMLSSGTFIGIPGSSYRIGFIFAICGVVSSYGFLFVLGGLGKKIGIVSRRTNSVSLIGLLKNRYNNNKFVVVLLAVCFIVFLSTYSATQIVGGARVFEMMTGSSYVIGLILFGVVVGVYSLFGGMKSVAQAALFQGVVMVAAVVFLIAGTVIHVNNDYGSMEALFQTLVGTPGENILSPYNILPPRFIISLGIMSAFSAAGLPHVIQGTMTYKNTNSLKKALFIGFGLTAVINLIMLLVGPITHAIDPTLSVPDNTTPYLAFMVLPGPVAGVILSGVAASIQSTIAGMMLIISAAIAKDLYKDIINPSVSDAGLKKLTLGVMGVAIVVVVALSINPPELLQFLVFFAMGGMGASIAMPLVLGLYWKRANEYGAIAGLIAGLGSYILASKYVPALSMGMIAFVVPCIISGFAVVLVSLITPKSPRGTIEVWFGKSYDKEFALRK
jgi:sodium/pantothenate symporter